MQKKGELVSYRPDIKVVDCTLRDGGIVNDFKFDDEFVEYNQVMGELKAALDAVSYCVQQGYKKMYVIHDYEGVAFYATGAWVNEDERLENLYVKQMKEYEKQIEITFVKVKSHVANKTKINRYNDRADELANLALGR